MLRGGSVDTEAEPRVLKETEIETPFHLVRVARRINISGPSSSVSLPRVHYVGGVGFRAGRRAGSRIPETQAGFCAPNFWPRLPERLRGGWGARLRPPPASRRRPGVESSRSSVSRVGAQGPVPADALRWAWSRPPARRLWRPLPSKRNTMKRVRAGNGIGSYSWLHPLPTPYPHSRL